MKGFSRREWYLLRPNAFFYGGFLAFFLVVCFFSQKAASFFPVYLLAFGNSSVLALFTYDETNGWRAYAAALPGGRRTMVDARYVTGLAIALVTILLYKDREKPEHHIFWIGTFLGGAYEYICSVFTEILFGKIFWDYSAMPFNLGGRINLLFCFFWGIAAVIWMKGLYPKTALLIERIRKKTGRLLTGILMAFMAANIVVSVMALIRYDARANGRPAVYGWEQSMDKHFGDARMERIYPNAKPQ